MVPYVFNLKKLNKTSLRTVFLVIFENNDHKIPKIVFKT